MSLVCDSCLRIQTVPGGLSVPFFDAYAAGRGSSMVDRLDKNSGRGREMTAGRRPPSTAVAQPALRAVVVAAARDFNTGRYFEAHEVLEDGLEVVPEALWELFVGLIQIAVGYH